MKKHLQRLLLLVVAILFMSSGYAQTEMVVGEVCYDVMIDSIGYKLNEEDNTAIVTSKRRVLMRDKDHSGRWVSYYDYRCDYSGDFTIPMSFTYKGKSYIVKGIDANAFNNNKGITSVTIPSTVKEIGKLYNSKLYVLGVTPPSVKYINSNDYESARLYVPAEAYETYKTTEPWSSFKNIESGIIYYAHEGQTLIYTILDKESMTCKVAGFAELGSGKVVVPPEIKDGNTTYKVTDIGDKAFSGCMGVTSIVLPNTITDIGEYAFSGCTGLTNIAVPESVVTIGKNAFSGCKLDPLYLCSGSLHRKVRRSSKLSIYSDCIAKLDSSSTICAFESEIDSLKKYWPGTIKEMVHKRVSFSSVRYGSVSFRLIYADASHEDVERYYELPLQSVKLDGVEVFPDEKGIYTVTGLTPNTKYGIVLAYKLPSGEERIWRDEVATGKPDVGASRSASTQTTLTITVSATADETFAAEKKGVRLYDEDYYCTDGKVVLSGLTPNREYRIVPFAEKGTIRIEGDDGYWWKTESLSPNITPQNVGPTSITVKGSYTKGDAHVTETGFTGQNTGNTLTLTGLTPNTSYTVNYYVKTKEGSNETISQKFTTSDLRLATLQPRGVSSTCSVVAAETNMSDDEINAGFQWKKYDAPESLKPSEGYAAIYNGQLEGYIRNLQPTFYYNVRAFYKSAEGKYYYGDWVTFDPSDFSYFEPTVHTYAATDVTHSSVRVKGYVLAGTDVIDEQGFEYWIVDAGRANALCVKAEAADNAHGVQTVLATGQVMQAELRNLQPGTTYCCRAFVKTTTGTTYGEEQTFTTEADPTGIGYVTVEEKAIPTVVGYYDLGGRKSTTPHRGVNIVRYSDGTTRKVIMR